MYLRHFGISALALAGVLVLADNAMAQRRFGAYAGTGYYDSGWYAGRGSYGGRWYGDSSYGGRGWYGNRYYGFGSPRYDSGFVGYSSDGYYDDSSYGGRRGRLFGRRSGGDYYYGSYSNGGSCHGGCHGSACHGGCNGSGRRGGYYGAGCTGGGYYGSSQNGTSYGAMPATNGGAFIQLKVPADATVTFDDQPTQQTGVIRDFITPPLEANKNLAYQVHVKAQNLDETRKVNVTSDQAVSIDFTMPQGSEGQRAAPAR